MESVLSESNHRLNTKMACGMPPGPRSENDILGSVYGTKQSSIHGGGKRRKASGAKHPEFQCGNVGLGP